jgi:hypothetical protein
MSGKCIKGLTGLKSGSPSTVSVVSALLVVRPVTLAIVSVCMCPRGERGRPGYSAAKCSRSCGPNADRVGEIAPKPLPTPRLRRRPSDVMLPVRESPLPLLPVSRAEKPDGPDELVRLGDACLAEVGAEPALEWPGLRPDGMECREA